jgi:hypothetical protein
MYLVVLSVFRNDQEDYRVWVAQATSKDRFALGESTRKAGLRELVAAGVLTDYTESVDFEGETGNRTYRRKIYRLEAAFQPN